MLSRTVVQGPEKFSALVHDVAEAGDITNEEAQRCINEDPGYTSSATLIPLHSAL